MTKGYLELRRQFLFWHSGLNKDDIFAALWTLRIQYTETECELAPESSTKFYSQWLLFISS